MQNIAALFVFLLLASLSIAEEHQAFGSYAGFPFVGYGIGSAGYVNVPWGGPGPVGGPYGVFAGIPPSYGGYPSYGGNAFGAKGIKDTSKGTGQLSQSRIQQLKQHVIGKGVVKQSQDVNGEITQPNQQNDSLESQTQQSSQQIQTNSPTQTSTQHVPSDSQQNPSLQQSSQIVESAPINSP